MIVISCIDDNGGTMFNRRRQSQDRALRARILALSENRTLWMSPYTARQFSEDEQRRFKLADAPQLSAGAGELCFVEGEPLLPYEDQIEAAILFRWNRVYPADTYFDILLDEPTWKLAEISEFSGYSHEKITQEVYVK